MAKQGCCVAFLFRRDRSRSRDKPKDQQESEDEQVVFTKPTVQQEPYQQWTFTDIVPGPFCDMIDGPLAGLPLSTSDSKIRIEIGAMTSAFSLSGTIKTVRPDLICSFGVWPNLLTDEICDKISPSMQCRPSDEHRRSVMFRQKKVFDDPPEFSLH